jgi:hypothetical protein
LLLKSISDCLLIIFLLSDKNHFLIPALENGTSGF